MIRSFKNKETEKIFYKEFSKRIPASVAAIARRKLVMIHAATQINTLRIPPSNHLEKLRGNRSGQYSIRVNQKWRICFKWRAGDAYDVEIVDYH